MALPWEILAQIRTENGSNEKHWAFSYTVSTQTKIPNGFAVVRQPFEFCPKTLAQRIFTGTLNEFVTNNKLKAIGFGLPFVQLMNPSNGLYNKNDDKLTLAIDVTLKEAEAMDKKASAAEQNNSFGTISMEIKKVSEFSCEHLYSNRTSETVYLKGFPWQLMANVNPNPNGVSSLDGSTELYLGFIFGVPV